VSHPRDGEARARVSPGCRGFRVQPTSTPCASATSNSDRCTPLHTMEDTSMNTDGADAAHGGVPAVRPPAQTTGPVPLAAPPPSTSSATTAAAASPRGSTAGEAPTASVSPLKRKRPPPSGPQSIASRSSQDPFALLALLTAQFDASSVLRQAAAAGFTVPLLERIDAVVAANVAERPYDAPLPSLYHVHTTSRGQLEADDTDAPVDESVFIVRPFVSPTVLPTKRRTTPKHAVRDGQLPNASGAEASSAATAGDSKSATAARAAKPSASGASAATHITPKAPPRFVSSAAMEVDSGAAVPKSAPVARFPFLHLSADRVRFRKADVPTVDWNRFKRRKQAHTTTASTSSSTAVQRITTEAANTPLSKAASETPQKSVPAATVSAPPPSTPSKEQPTAPSTPAAATASAATASSAPSSAPRRVPAEPASSLVSFEEIAAGLTPRQARFLHTNLTPSNILPGSRRSAGKPTRLPWEQVDWKGRLKDD